MDRVNHQEAMQAQAAELQAQALNDDPSTFQKVDFIDDISEEEHLSSDRLIWIVALH